MTNKAYQNQKISLKYSKSQIEKSGRSIRHACEGDEREDAVLKIQNYREMHLYPLMLIKNHLVKSVNRVSKSGLVARRLKMLSTIIDKLERPSLDGKSQNSISLTRMQDIGGCRAIVSNLKQLKALHKRLIASRSVHSIIRTDNYLIPKDSGYSGIHLVYSCFLGSKEESEWKKTKIEVQLRTDLQHAWATSLEIIDTLEGIKLKTSVEGHQNWRRFFCLAGMLVAHDEKSCELSLDELPSIVKELTELEKGLYVRKKLVEYNLAIRITTDKNSVPRSVLIHQGMFLVKVQRGEKDGKKKLHILLQSFSPKETDHALLELAASEVDPNVFLSVLVSAGDVRSLKRAYPNFFGSTTKFNDFLSKYIGVSEV